MRGSLAGPAAIGCVVVLAAACGGAGATPASEPPASVESAAASVAAAASPTPQATPIVVGDGEPWVAYQWSAGSGDGIFLVRPDGTGNHQLVPDMAGSEIHPDWSPDGSSLAFVRQVPDGTTELLVVDPDGANEKVLYTCALPCNEIHYPDWSSDGEWIYFSQSADVPEGGGIPQTFSFGRVNVADGSASLVRTRDDGLEMWQARVSPDGSRIAYAVGGEGFGAAIFTARVDGGEETRVTEGDLLAAHPDWTEDGRIVFHTFDLAIFPVLAEPANAYLVDADGGNLEQLTDFTDPGLRAAQTRVAPDGSGVTFTHVGGEGANRRLGFIAFGESEPRWLTTEPMSGTHPHLRPVRE